MQIQMMQAILEKPEDEQSTGSAIPRTRAATTVVCFLCRKDVDTKLVDVVRHSRQREVFVCKHHARS